VIPKPHITEWAAVAPWQTAEQIEQDLLLSRLIVEIANDDYLGSELVFRGGTCLHKLRIAPAMRYSEDLDYVRRTDGGIAAMIDALRAIGSRLDMKVSYERSSKHSVRTAQPESREGSPSTIWLPSCFDRSSATI
jgi:predicted nucleotidyltransferase component of viral defense system